MTDAPVNAVSFVGPLPETLTREHETGVVRFRSRYSTAKDFVLACGDFMRTMGRDVQVTDEADSVAVYSPGPRWFDSSILVTAYRKSRRWRFGVAVDISRNEQRSDYASARVLVEAYGQ